MDYVVNNRLSGFIHTFPTGSVAISRAFKDITDTDNTEIVAAPGAGIIIRIIFATIVCKSAVDVHFESASTQISATQGFGASGGIIRPENVHGWFQTAPGEALNVNLSAIADVGVEVGYILITE